MMTSRSRLTNTIGPVYITERSVTYYTASNGRPEDTPI